MKFALVLSTIAGALFGYAIMAGFVYAVTHYLIGLDQTYLQVLGVVILIDTFKNFMRDE